MQTVTSILPYPVLSTLIFLPLVGAAILLLVSRAQERLIKWIALVVGIIVFLLSLPLATDFDKTTYLMQFVERYQWIPSWGITYYVGIDGISVLFVLLSTLVTILCIMVSWSSIKAKVKEFYIALLVIEGAMIGGFALVAWPADYRVTGVQTFIVSYDGVVYQKDLGPDTAKIASAMERYDPDKTWVETDDDWH